MSAWGSKSERVREHVLDLVETMAVGDRIPAERKLAEELDVSRMTLRGVIDELVREGYLNRRHGSGSYVAEPKIAQPLTMTSFSDDMRLRGFVPSGRTLELVTVAAGARLARRLQVSPTEPVVRALRLRLADDVPMAIETLHVLAALVPGLTAGDLERSSFYDLLAARYGVQLGTGAQVIEPTVTSEEESARLGVPVHSPAFLFERTTRDKAGAVVEFVRSIYRGDRYQLTATLLAPKRRDQDRARGGPAPTIAESHP